MDSGSHYVSFIQTALFPLITRCAIPVPINTIAEFVVLNATEFVTYPSDMNVALFEIVQLRSGHKMPIWFQKTVDLEVNHIAEVPAISPVAGTEPEMAMETGCSRPLCIGPGCSKPALQESVYCGNVCIVQHAALTMKSLSDTKVSNPRGQVQKKATAVMPTAKVNPSSHFKRSDLEKLCQFKCLMSENIFPLRVKALVGCLRG